MIVRGESGIRLRFGVLGPVVVTDGDRAPLPVRVGKQTALLAVLLAARGEAVSIDRLVEVLWRTDTGHVDERARRSNLQVLVHRLRTTVGEDRIVHTAGAYRLLVQPGELDSERFEATADVGRSASERGDHSAAAEALAEALSWFRGDPYAGWDDLEPVWSESTRLAELRWSVLEDRIDAELALGRHARVVGELAGLIDQHPARERLRAQHMLALYRSGRPQEALDAYRSARRALVDELGLEPGSALRELEQAILTEDPSLAPPDSPATGTPARAANVRPWSIPAELPPRNPAFSGRHTELDRLARTLTGPPEAGGPMAISGPGGVGKSTLAVQAAHAIADRFEDGQLYVNLHGATPGLTPLESGTVLARFLRSCGIPEADIPADVDEAAARFRSLTADRRMLIVLDDAADAAQVRPLLPSTRSGSSALITGRPLLSTLDGVAHLTLGTLTEDEAVVLLARLVGNERVASDPDTAARIVRVCERLPLAVRIVGARLTARPDWTLAGFADRLDDTHARLDELQHDDLAVRTSFAVGYDPLPETTRRLLALIGLLDLPTIGLDIAARLADRPTADVSRDLDTLVEAQLLEPTGTHGGLDSDRTAEGYRMHDLHRLCARDRAEAEVDTPSRAAAIERVAAWYIGTGCHLTWSIGSMPDRRLRHFRPGILTEDVGRRFSGPDAAANWFTAELGNFSPLAVAVTRLPQGAETLAGLGIALYEGFSKLGYWQLGIRFCGSVADVARTAGDEVDAARRIAIERDTGRLLDRLGRSGEASEHFDRAVSEARVIGDRASEAMALSDRGNNACLLGDDADALERFEQALAIARQERALMPEFAALHGLTRIWFQAGRRADALGAIQRCVDILRIEGRTEEPEYAYILTNLCKVHLVVGQPNEAAEVCRSAIELLRARRWHQYEAFMRWRLAQALRALGRHDEATIERREALRILCDRELIDESEAESILADPDPTIPTPLRNL